MILNEEIIKLANTYGFDRHISKTTHDIYWECDEEDLLKFARAFYEEGYEEGYAEGYSRGYDVGEEIGYDRGTLDGE
jgi:flagellar biosynthesis/type III secretory pathway protein FliH